MKPLPQFSSARCKRCGICSHFCAVQAIATNDGMPYLTDPDVCTSCGVCQDMCPDWAISLEPTPVEEKERPEKSVDSVAEGPALAQDAHTDDDDAAESSGEEPIDEASGSGELEVTAAAPAGDGSGATR